MANMMPYDRRGHSLWNGLDNFERLFFDGWGGAQSMPFRTDVVDKGDHYMLTAAMPGVDKKDLNIELHGDGMVISAKSHYESNVEEKNYVRRERRSGSFSRSLDGSGIDTDNIKASYENGVLEVTLPKAKDQGNGKRRIDVK